MDIYPVAGFVNDRLTDAETAAHAAGDAPWQTIVWPGGTQILISAAAIRDNKWKYGQTIHHIGMIDHQEYADHMVRHSPAQVLAQVAAQRLIVSNMCSLHAAAWQYADARLAIEHLTLTTVRRMAQLDADHTDYRPEWAL